MNRMADLDAAIARFHIRHAAAHPIPPIMDPLGSSWDQPDRSRIEIDATHALMDRQTFGELMEYSGTNPSGVYAGKMWRRHDGLFDHSFRALGGRPQWMLCWFGLSERPGFVSNNHRLIILSDGDLPEATP